MNNSEQLIPKYTHPEQYITYLTDNELSMLLKGVLSIEYPVQNLIEAELELEQVVFTLAGTISKQFGYAFDVSLSCIIETVYKEAAKRWLNRMNNCCKNKEKG